MYLNYQHYLKDEIAKELKLEYVENIPDLIQLINIEKMGDMLLKRSRISDKVDRLLNQLEILHLFFSSSIENFYGMIYSTLVSNFYAYISELAFALFLWKREYLKLEDLEPRDRQRYFDNDDKFESQIGEYIKFEFSRGISGTRKKIHFHFGLNLSENENDWNKYVTCFERRNKIIHPKEINSFAIESINESRLNEDQNNLIDLIDLFVKFKNIISKHVENMVSIK